MEVDSNILIFRLRVIKLIFPQYWRKISKDEVPVSNLILDYMEISIFCLSHKINFFHHLTSIYNPKYVSTLELCLWVSFFNDEKIQILWPWDKKLKCCWYLPYIMHSVKSYSRLYEDFNLLSQS
jgi:hypothetical protein